MATSVRHKPLSRVPGALLGAALILFFSHTAHASGAVEGSLAPISVNAPATTYPNAFTGMGLGAQIDYYFHVSPWALNLGFFSQGQGQFEYFQARYYFVGHSPDPGIGSVEKSTAPLVVEAKSRGFFVDFGTAFYQLSSTTTTALLEEEKVTSGFGPVAGVGLEQPFIWGTFLGLEAKFFGTFATSSVNVGIFSLSVGIPFGF